MRRVRPCDNTMSQHEVVSPSRSEVTSDSEGSPTGLHRVAVEPMQLFRAAVKDDREEWQKKAEGRSHALPIETLLNHAEGPPSARRPSTLVGMPWWGASALDLAVEAAKAEEEEAKKAENATAPGPDGVQSNAFGGVIDSRSAGLQAYEVLQAVGKGKFAVVYRARRISDGRIVALKRVSVNEMDLKARTKALKEVRLVQSLNHRNVVQYLDSFLEGNELVIALEWAEAGDLKRQIRKANERGRRFSERVVWKYFSQIADAICHMHSRRVMHRDLKPANIFLNMNGTVKVLALLVPRRG